MTDIRRTLGEFTTPPGRLCWTHLNEPDTNFGEEEAKQKYKASIRLSGHCASEFLALTENAWNDWLEIVKAATGKKPKVVAKNIQWFTADTKLWDDIGDGTAKLIADLQADESFFKTSCKAYRDGAPSPPKFFDAEGEGIKYADVPPIGPGTEAALSGWFYGYTVQGKANMSLLLRAVQLINPREPGKGPENAEDFGFKPQKGYVNEVEKFAEHISGDDKQGNF